MNLLVQLLIQFYWACYPSSLKGKCLFKESCSNYVFRISKQEGFVAALRAVIFRYRNCRSGYNIIEIEGKKVLVSKSKGLFSQDDIKEEVFVFHN